MQILTHDQLHRTAPAIFADQPDHAVSDRYGFVPTINVVDALQEEGWYPVRAQQTNVRNPERRGTTRHLIRFRQDPDRQISVGDSVTELVLTNSHDRSAAYQLDLGLFRLVCSNGMVTPVGDLGGIRVRHGRHIVDEIVEGSIHLSHQVPKIAEGVEAFRSTLISPATAWWYAEAALALRYGQHWRRTSPIQAGDLLEARRSEDANDSLWSVFNRTQENLFKGGLRGRSPSGRATRTHAIHSVSEDVRLNRALWKLTESLAGVDSMRLSGDQAIRIDFTDPDNQVTGVDLNRNGVIDRNGVENNSPLKASGFEVIDAYARNPLNQTDAVNNFLGNIHYDGTGFDGDGRNTDGNIFLGGLGADIAFGGIGNDFLAGGGVAAGRYVTDPASGMVRDTLTGAILPAALTDDLEGGRNADFFFVELSALDPTDAPSNIDGGETADDTAAANANSSMDSDWLLLEASDDDEPVVITLSNSDGRVVSNGSSLNNSSVDLDEIENLDASGNLYGFLDDLNTTIGARAGQGHTAGEVNYGIGSTAQLQVIGSETANIIIGGFDNDNIDGGAGNDILMGGNLAFNNNPNTQNIVNNGVDVLVGGAGNDHVVYELDGGTYHGDTATAIAGTDSDTLWIESRVAGTSTVEALTADGIIRIDLMAPASAGQGTGGNDTLSQSQTNSTLAGTVTGFENVIATGLGAIDFLAAGTNDPELNFNNQQNFFGVAADLELRGSAGNNKLYANSGNDVIEGREGNDSLMGGQGNDDFIFDLGNGGDGLDTIHRQDDAGNNIWAGTTSQDFGLDQNSSVSNSALNLTITDPNNPGAELGDIVTRVTSIESVVFVDGGDDIPFELASDGIRAASTFAELLDAVNEAIDNLSNADLAENLSATLNGNTITITDALGREMADTAAEGGFFSVSLPAQSTVETDMVFGAPEAEVAQDRLIFNAYEDRADNESNDDNAYVDETGDSASLGTVNYAEDLVVGFGVNANYGTKEGTTLAERQSFNITLTNVADEDIVTVSINGASYSLRMGVELDGSPIIETDIQFAARLANMIAVSDNGTKAGDLAATATPGTTTITITQQDADATDLGQAVFMERPVVTITNGSGGEKATATVVEGSDSSIFLEGFDGRDGLLKGTEGNLDDTDVTGNIFFVGDARENRSILATAEAAGGALVGMNAIVVDTLADSDSIANDYALHGDDLLITGAGDDVVTAGTGDDRIYGSVGDDTVDGGKDLFRVYLQGQTEPTIETMNLSEAIARLSDPSVARITTLAQDRDAGTAGVGEVIEIELNTDSLNSNGFEDELVFQQANFSDTASFTITLDDDLSLANGGAGTVTEASTASTTTFVEIEQIRTASGNGKLSGQGTDTLNIDALSDAAVASAANGSVANAGAGVSFDMLTGQVEVNADFNNSDGSLETREFTRVVGVENVISGNGDDTVTISHTEIGKNNTINLGSETLNTAHQGDTVKYDYTLFDGGAGQQLTAPVTRVTVETANETDTVTTSGFFNGPASALVTATDTLVDVETIEFVNGPDGVTAVNGIEDVLDVTNLNDAVVNYGAAVTILASKGGTTVVPTDDNTRLEAGAISQDGNNLGIEVLSITNMLGLERVEAGDGDDRVIVGDNMSAANALLGAGNLGVSYLDYVDNITNGAEASVGNDTIEASRINLHQFDLGAGDDTVDYRQEASGDVVLQVATAIDGQDAIIVDDNSDGDLTDAADRVDLAIGVENYIGGTGTNNIIDLTTATVDATVEFSVDDGSADTFEVEDPNGVAAGVDGTFTTTEIRNGANVYANLLQDTADTATFWNVIYGGNFAETIIFSNWESGVNNQMFLGGGSNVVDYSRLSSDVTDGTPVTNGVTLTFANSEEDAAINRVETEYSLTTGNGDTDTIHIQRGTGVDVSTGGLTVKGSSESADTINISALTSIASGTVDLNSYHVVNLTTGKVIEDALDTGATATDGDVVGGLVTTISGFENIVGSGENDRLTGNASANIITAGNGDDQLRGEGADDTLTGDAGADRFIFDSAADSFDNVTAAAFDDATIEGDTVTDFVSGTDKFVIELSDSFNAGDFSTFVQTGSANGLLGTDSVGAIFIGVLDDGVGPAGATNVVQVLLGAGTNGTIDGWALNSDDAILTVKDSLVAITASDIVLNLTQSSGSDTQDLGSASGPSVEIVYTAQNQSLLGARDTFTNFNMLTDTLDFTSFITPLSKDNVTGVDFDEAVKVESPVSVDNAGQVTDFFQQTRDIDGKDDDSGVVAGTPDGLVDVGVPGGFDTGDLATETFDVTFVLQNERGTANYRLFVDVNGDGDFDQDDDMVIDFIDEVGGIPVADVDVLEALASRMFVGINPNQDFLLGTAGADTLDATVDGDFPGREADQLFGFGGADTLNGGVGNDILTGGLGADTLTGGAGNDSFEFNATSEFGDIITDFAVAEDSINLNSALVGNNLRGDGNAVESLNTLAAFVIGANTGLIINSGANSADLTVGTQETDLANGTYAAGDALYYLTDNGVDSALFYFKDANADGLVTAGEVSLVVTLTGVADATTLDGANFADFA